MLEIKHRERIWSSKFYGHFLMRKSDRAQLSHKLREMCNEEMAFLALWVLTWERCGFNWEIKS